MFGSKLRVKYDHKRRSGKSLEWIWSSAALLIWTDLRWVRRAVGAGRVGLPGLTLKHHSPVLTVVELAGGSERVREWCWEVRSEEWGPPAWPARHKWLQSQHSSVTTQLTTNKQSSSLPENSSFYIISPRQQHWG